eukprot:14963-Prorocentrum_minimum.AAC.2
MVDEPRLFLLPTGKKGNNDYTLNEAVAPLNHPVWGFSSGNKRLFERTRPGDIYLMCSSGEPFNRVGEVSAKLARVRAH